MTVIELRKQCSLAAQAGIRESCQRDTCAFWQVGSDDVVGGCAIEGLDRGGLDAADFLLGLRGRLEFYSLFA